MGSVASANCMTAGDIQPFGVIYWKRNEKISISVRIKSKLRKQKIQTEGRVSCLEWLGERRQTGLYEKGKLDSRYRVLELR